MKTIILFASLIFATFAQASEGDFSNIKSFEGLWKGTGQMVSGHFAGDPKENKACEAIANISMTDGGDWGKPDRWYFKPRVVLTCDGYGQNIDLDSSYFIRPNGVIESGTVYGSEDGENGLYMRNFIKLTNGPKGRSSTVTLELIDKTFSGGGRLIVKTTFGIFVLEKL